MSWIVARLRRKFSQLPERSDAARICRMSRTAQRVLSHDRWLRLTRTVKVGVPASSSRMSPPSYRTAAMRPMLTIWLRWTRTNWLSSRRSSTSSNVNGQESVAVSSKKTVRCPSPRAATRGQQPRRPPVPGRKDGVDLPVRALGLTEFSYDLLDTREPFLLSWQLIHQI
jgi:hypothetical protein